MLVEMARAKRALVASPTLLEVEDVQKAVLFLSEVGVLCFVFWLPYFLSPLSMPLFLEL